MVQQKPGAGTDVDYETNFQMGTDQTLSSVLTALREVAAGPTTWWASTSRIQSVPKDVPWFPDDIDASSVRWVLLHLMQETARHTGHADIVREWVDGASAFPLMAAAEGWPVTPWMTRWSRRREASSPPGRWALEREGRVSSWLPRPRRRIGRRQLSRGRAWSTTSTKSAVATVGALYDELGLGGSVLDLIGSWVSHFRARRNG